MEIIKMWDLCIYSSCSFEIEVTRGWKGLQFKFFIFNLLFAQQQAQSSSYMRSLHDHVQSTEKRLLPEQTL